MLIYRITPWLYSQGLNIKILTHDDWVSFLVELHSVTGSLGKDSTLFYKLQLHIPRKESTQVKHHVYVKRQTRIYTT